jgi:phenylpyruvate tautomerase PptA (4-oxalocrotonate tautomerase family)
MGKINIAIKDETEKRLRQAIAEFMGLKKGNISIAIEEAIDLWIDNKSASIIQRITEIGC